MTLDQLKYFVEAARYQHIGKAARAAAISPSAVSGAIAALEEELGCKLFDRQGKTIRLNPAGNELLRRAQQLLQDASSIQKDLNAAHKPLEGVFKMAGSPFLALEYLTRAWASLREKNPQLQAEIYALPTATVIKEIVAGTVDFGLCFSPLKHPGLHQIPLYGGQLKIAVAHHHPLLKKKAPLDALKGLSEFSALVHKPVSGVDLCDTHPMFDRFEISLKTEMLFEGDDLAVRSIGQSHAWSLLPDLIIEANSDTLCALPLPKSWDAPYTISGVCLDHRKDSRLVQAVLDALRRTL